jgi:tight adherence protein B
MLPPPPARRRGARRCGTLTGQIAVVVTAAVLALAVRPARAVARSRIRARLASPEPAAAVARSGPAPAALALAVGGLAMAGLVAGPSAALALAAAATAVPVTARLRARARERNRRDHQLPGALERLATALRSGASLPQALREVGEALDPPLGPEVAALARAAERGRPLREVLDEWSATHNDSGTRLAATALVLATVVGTTPARAVDGVAATVRERLDLAAERRALAVQARTSALVLSVAPVGFAALLVVGDTAAAGFLLGTPGGWACLALGVGLDLAGAWWMTRLSRSDRW